MLQVVTVVVIQQHVESASSAMGRRTEIVRSVCALAREMGVGGGVGRREGYTPELWPHSRSLTLPESQPLL